MLPYAPHAKENKDFPAPDKRQTKGNLSSSYLLSKALSHYYRNRDKLAIRDFEKYLFIYGRSVVAFRYLGILHFRMGDSAKAIHYLEEALEFEPEDMRSLQILGQIYLNSGKWEEARVTYEKALKVNPMEISVLEILAQIYERKKNMHRSIVLYKKLLLAARRSFHVQGIYQGLQKLGRYYYNRQNYEKAMRYYKELNKLDQGGIQSTYALASIYKLQGKIMRSIEQYKRVIKLDPKSRLSRYELIENYYLIKSPKSRMEAARFISEFKKVPDLIRGIYAEQNGDTEEAEYHFRLVLERRPNTLSAHIGMANIYQKLNDREKLQKEMFFVVYLAQKIKAFQISREYALSLLNILDEESKEIGFSQAFFKANGGHEIRILNDAIKELATSYIDIYSAHADTMNQLNQIRAAVSYYDKSLFYLKQLERWSEKDESLSKLLTEREGELLMNLGWLLYQEPLGKYTRSIQVLKEATLLSPEDPRVNFLLGLVYYNRGKTDKKHYKSAIKYIERAIQMTPDDKASGNYFFYLGVSLEKIDQFERAEESFKKAIEREPRNSLYLNYLGYSYSIRGIKYPEANELLLRALEDDPENEAYLDSLGWLLYKRGQYEEALEKLLMAVYQAEKKKNPDSILYLHLAKTYDKLKEYALAAVYFTKTLENKDLASEEIDEEYIKERLKFLETQKNP